MGSRLSTLSQSLWRHESLIMATQNPFDFVKASDFSDEQIAQYWVDVAGEAGLEELFQPLQVMPMLLLGGKGSGKTHLMRYFSAPVRRLQTQGSIRVAVEADNYLGIYVQANALNVGRFEGKGIDESQWGSIFSYYCELWLAVQFLRNLSELTLESPRDWNESEFVSAVALLFTCHPPQATTLNDLLAHFAVLRKNIDHVVANVATGRSALSEIDIRTSPGDLVFGLPEALHATTISLKPFFIYMIDEVENFTETQQRVLNSLIRYRRGPVSIKIGARLYGLRTRATWGGSGETIHNGSEFNQVELDQWLRDHVSEYSEFARKMVVKRLEASGVVRLGVITPQDVDKFFAEVDRSNFYQAPTLAMVKKFDASGEPRPYFVRLEEHISEWGTNVDREQSSSIIAALSYPDFPLLEKVNVYLLYRDWFNEASLNETARSIRTKLIDVMEERKSIGGRDFLDTYEHFHSDFLAQLSRECKVQRISYSGFTTLLHLSQGFPRNLLNLLKQIYRRSLFAGEQPFTDGAMIAISTQNEGVRDAAEWFWDDAQPDRHGPESRVAIQALAEVFAGIRFSPKPAECSVGTFTVLAGGGTERAREVLTYAKNWSYLIQIKGVGSDRNNADATDDKYQLSPMLAPRWDVSEKRRGAIRLNEDLFNAIFDSAFRDRLKSLVGARLGAMQNPGRPNAQGDIRQERLF